MVKTTDGDVARVLYKKSYTSYSKTCSSISNQTRLIPKRKSSNKGFYNDGGKIKRDLSIETDLCRVRRRCRNLLKLSDADVLSLLTSTNKTPKSARSWYSDFTQIEPIEENCKDDCASGDSNSAVQLPNNIVMDKENLMYNNLYDLVKTWMQHVVEDKELKDILGRFDTALKETKLKKAEISSSCTTYVLERNESFTSSNLCYSITEKLSDQKSSYILPSYNTIPILYKTVRLISTLSIPRNIHKRQKYKKRQQRIRVRKGKHNKTLVTLIQPNKYGFDCSNTKINLFAITAKSWFKECANIDENQLKKELMKENYAQKINPRNKSLMNVERCDVKSYYTTKSDKNYRTYDILDIPGIDASVEDYNRKQYNFCKKEIITSAIISKNVPIEEKRKSSNNRTTSSGKTTKNPPCRFKTGHTSVKKTVKEKNIDPALHNKVSEKIQEENKLLNALRDLLEYLEKHDTPKDVRLDFQVNVFPTYRVSTTDCSLDQEEFMKKPTYVYSYSSPKHVALKKDQKLNTDCPKIIPLLDSAVSQAKYLIDKPQCKSCSTEPKNKHDQGSMTNEFGFKGELHGIRTALKHVATLVHRYLPDQLKNPETYKKTCQSPAFQEQCPNVKIIRSPSLEHIDYIKCPYCKRETSKLYGKIPTTGTPSPELALHRPEKNERNETCKDYTDKLLLKPSNSSQTKTKDYTEIILKQLCKDCKTEVLKHSFLEYKEMISRHICGKCMDTLDVSKRRTQTARETMSSVTTHLCNHCKRTVEKCLPKDSSTPLMPYPLPACPPEEYIMSISELLCSHCKAIVCKVHSQENDTLEVPKQLPRQTVKYRDAKGGSPNLSPKASNSSRSKATKYIENSTQSKATGYTEKTTQGKAVDYTEIILKQVCDECKMKVIKSSFWEYKEIVARYICRDCMYNLGISSRCAQITKETISSVAIHFCKKCRISLSKQLPKDSKTLLIPTPAPNPPEEFIKSISELLCSHCRHILLLIFVKERDMGVMTVSKEKVRTEKFNEKLKAEKRLDEKLKREKHKEEKNKKEKLKEEKRKMEKLEKIKRKHEKRNDKKQEKGGKEKKNLFCRDESKKNTSLCPSQSMTEKDMLQEELKYPVIHGTSSTGIHKTRSSGFKAPPPSVNPTKKQMVSKQTPPHIKKFSKCTNCSCTKNLAKKKDILNQYSFTVETKPSFHDEDTVISINHACIGPPSFADRQEFSACFCPSLEMKSTTGIHNPTPFKKRTTTRGQKNIDCFFVNKSIGKHASDIFGIELCKISKTPFLSGFQISNRLNSDILNSGIKLSKEGKLSPRETRKRKFMGSTKKYPKEKLSLKEMRMRKSIDSAKRLRTLASYRIIESESLIKVTDMTSTAQRDSTAIKPVSADIALTCSLPQTISLYEISSHKIDKTLHSNRASFKSNANKDSKGQMPASNVYPLIHEPVMEDNGYRESAIKQEKVGKPFAVKSRCLGMDSDVESALTDSMKECKSLSSTIKTKFWHAFWFVLVATLLIYFGYLLHSTFLKKVTSKAPPVKLKAQKRLLQQKLGIKLSDLGF